MPKSSLKALTSALASFTPTKSLSPSETPAITGTLSPCAAKTIPLNISKVEKLKWPMARRCSSASFMHSRKVFMTQLYHTTFVNLTKNCVTPHTPNHTPNQFSGSLCRRDRRTESSMARLSAVLFVREPKEIFLLSTRLRSDLSAKLFVSGISGLDRQARYLEMF